MKQGKNLKRRFLDWLDLYPADEVEQIVDFSTVQHKTASAEIDRLRVALETAKGITKAEFASMIAYDPSKVIKKDNLGNLKLGEYQLTDQEAKRLKEDATFLKQSEIWGVFRNTLTELARQNMFEAGGVKNTNQCDFHVGRATIFDIKAMEKIMEQILE